MNLSSAIDTPPLILASSSRYRKGLLERAGFSPECIAPNIDETPQLGESPAACAERLSIAKAQAIAKQHRAAIVIGSDQVAALGDKLLSKPGTIAVAQQQLMAQSGQTVEFHTGLCVCYGDDLLATVVSTRVQFRTLTEREITHYLQREQPFDCAGSFKSEGLGINLFERITSDDPSALVGLPLIKTTEFLRTFGLNVLFA